MEEGQPKEQIAPHNSETSSDSTMVMASAEVEFSGPLPPPAVLQGYEDIVPGAANRILEMAERQSEHRQQLEKTVVNGESRMSILGLVAGFVLSTMVIGGGIYLIASGHDFAGAALIGINLVGLATVFVYGSSKRRHEQQSDVDKGGTDA